MPCHSAGNTGPVGRRRAIDDPLQTKVYEELRGLARRSDVLLETFAPGAMEALGLGYDSLRAADPRLEPLMRELQRVAEDAAAVAASDAGLEFGPGRGPVAVLGDED